MKYHRKMGWAVVSSALVVMGITALPVMAQEDYPSRQITIVVPFTPGGGADMIGRALANGLAMHLDVPVIVENRPGAGTFLGTEYVRSSPPDGYAAVLQSNSYVTNALMSDDRPYDPLTALAPVTLLASNLFVLVTGPESGLTSIGDVIERVGEAPDSISYSSTGYLTGSDLAGQVISAELDAEFLHIPYNGAAAAQVSVMTGDTDLFFATYTGVQGLLESGDLIAIAVTSAERSELLPDVPTLREEGLDLELGVWYGLSVAPDTPAEIIETFNQAVVEVLNSPEVSRSLIAGGNEVRATSVEEFQQFLADDVAFWSNFEAATEE